MPLSARLFSPVALCGCWGFVALGSAFLRYFRLEIPSGLSPLFVSASLSPFAPFFFAWCVPPSLFFLSFSFSPFAGFGASSRLFWVSFLCVTGNSPCALRSSATSFANLPCRNNLRSQGRSFSREAPTLLPPSRLVHFWCAAPRVQGSAKDLAFRLKRGER